MKAFLAVFISLLIFGYCSAIISSFTPLYRYVKSSGGSRHYYTTNLNKIGTAIAGHKGKYGYRSEGISCILSSQSCKNVYHNNYIIIIFITLAASVVVPLYRYGKGLNYLYTTNSSEIGTTVKGATGTDGYRYYGITGYCYPVQVPNTLPLYRYDNPTNGDHLYTTDANEIGIVTPGHTGKNGYIYEEIACFVYRYASP